ncbi:MAG: nuclear transport factor 2 family protein [Proteobacteria bacterium]|nr:nuclear transport factor 2 family protein [Pseudomonadota bacterium]
MSSITREAIEAFLHGQVAAWNDNDKDSFLAHYRAAAPGGLTIEYVGHPPSDGWLVLERMWQQQNAKIEIEEVAVIINGNEVACHNRNKVKGSALAIDTIELYRFDDDGCVTVRYFIRQP